MPFNNRSKLLEGDTAFLQASSPITSSTRRRLGNDSGSSTEVSPGNSMKRVGGTQREGGSGSDGGAGGSENRINIQRRRRSSIPSEANQSTQSFVDPYSSGGETHTRTRKARGGRRGSMPVGLQMLSSERPCDNGALDGVGLGQRTRSDITHNGEF